MYNIKTNLSLIRLMESWANTENPFNSTEEILGWVAQRNADVHVKIDKINYDYSDSEKWHYDKQYGEICNKARSFFQVKGLQKCIGEDVVYEQPIIIQSEIGYLGIIAKVIDGVMYFLMQAKIEPGNVNKIQISPTLQATKSNFMRAHGGNTPAYLEFFAQKRKYEIIVDQIQSEQSSRFWGKRNRNIIIVVNDDITVLDTHKWMTLGQIKELMQYDNLVNMDTRTVISCIPFALRDFSYKEIAYMKSLCSREDFFNSLFFGNSGIEINSIYQYMNEVKMLEDKKSHLVDLYSLSTWHFNEFGEFESKNQRRGDFKLVYCSIEIEGREVRRWEQPLLEAMGQSVFGLLYCVEDYTTKYLIHCVTEVGCFDKIEIGPSVQLGPRDNTLTIVEALFKHNLEHNKGIEFSGLFSEEGGRFYQEQNRNIIMRIKKTDLPDPLPDGYFWADYQTLNVLIQFNNCLNIQLRNLLSILKL